MHKIKVFTSNASPREAGDHLTKLIADWQSTPPEKKAYSIINVHTTSNTYGWMVTVTYSEYNV